MLPFFAFVSPWILPVGLALDFLWGDPPHWPHPVIYIGWCISHAERLLHRPWHSPSVALAAGSILAIGLPLAVWGICYTLIFVCLYMHAWLGLALSCWLCYRIVAIRSMYDQSMRVYHCLKANDLPAARQAVSWIVGRDTGNLDVSGVIRATVETIAENATDAVIAPMMAIALGGVPLGMAYKTVNTLDSMVGYKNDSYLYFGRASARFDDVLNFIPARFAALIMIVVAAMHPKLSGTRALRVFKRDRYQHASPNSAQTESVCAGALGVQLGGSSSYKGILHEKPTIGDAIRPLCVEDIPLANVLYRQTALLTLVVLALLHITIATCFV